ncbi:hypothetical protein [Deinococcus altitudinis]|uniref:hypothetical protein n=1 Tax=Deinococcus altitudinis TaxID=468914 RepID=UPI003892154F
MRKLIMFVLLLAGTVEARTVAMPDIFTALKLKSAQRPGLPGTYDLTSLSPSGQTLRFVAQASVDPNSNRVTTFTLTSGVSPNESDADLAGSTGSIVGDFLSLPKVCFGTSKDEIDLAGKFFIDIFGPDAPTLTDEATYSKTFGKTLYEFAYSASGLTLKMHTSELSGDISCTL